MGISNGPSDTFTPLDLGQVLITLGLGYLAVYVVMKLRAMKVRNSGDVTERRGALTNTQNSGKERVLDRCTIRHDITAGTGDPGFVEVRIHPSIN
jgi:hypothetical protein